MNPRTDSVRRQPGPALPDGRRQSISRLLAGAGLTLAMWAATSTPALAAFPERPIRLIIGFPAGGPLDTHARLLADMPASERPAIEVMRTDTPTWAALVEASRHAIGPWAVRSALHSNICNRSVPTRPIAAPSQS